MGEAHLLGVRVNEPDAVPMLSLTDYLRSTGHSERTVRRCLADGRLPDAAKDGRGNWWIPADAQPLPAGSGASVVVHRPRQQVAHATAPAAVVPRVLAPGLWELDDAAQVLGTNVGGLTRLAKVHPQYLVGPWGRRLRPMLYVL